MYVWTHICMYVYTYSSYSFLTRRLRNHSKPGCRLRCLLHSESKIRGLGFRV